MLFRSGPEAGGQTYSGEETDDDANGLHAREQAMAGGLSESNRQMAGSWWMDGGISDGDGSPNGIRRFLVEYRTMEDWGKINATPPRPSPPIPLVEGKLAGREIARSRSVG